MLVVHTTADVWANADIPVYFDQLIQIWPSKVIFLITDSLIWHSS